MVLFKRWLDCQQPVLNFDPFIQEMKNQNILASYFPIISYKIISIKRVRKKPYNGPAHSTLFNQCDTKCESLILHNLLFHFVFVFAFYSLKNKTNLIMMNFLLMCRSANSSFLFKTIPFVALQDRTVLSKWHVCFCAYAHAWASLW